MNIQMHKIQVDLSHKQLHKLKKGGKVRIKKGTGFNLIVSPANFNLMTRSFGRSKGLDVVLSPEELQANRNLIPEIEDATLGSAQADQMEPSDIQGKGIFGKHADRLLEKHGLKKKAYKVGDILKPGAKMAIKAGLTAGATALAGTNPELAPFLPTGVMIANHFASDYLDNPHKYIGRGLEDSKSTKSIQSGLLSRPIRTLTDQIAQGKASDIINNRLDTNFNYMGRAGLGNMDQEHANQLMNSHLIELRHKEKPIEEYNDDFEGPKSIGHGIRSTLREGGSIGLGGGRLNAFHIPPALQSQPYGANYQMQHFLPPQYQMYFDPSLDHDHNASIGSGLYAGVGQGLYANQRRGRGLYAGAGLYAGVGQGLYAGAGLYN
jgi:hypothetical protein